MKKKIKVTYSGTKEKTIDEIIRNLIKSHKKIKNTDYKKKAANE